jgi:hypothetical protein
MKKSSDVELLKLVENTRKELAAYRAAQAKVMKELIEVTDLVAKLDHILKQTGKK